jgi:hypothetical protein
MITKNKIMAMAASVLLVATSGMAQNATKAPAAGQTKSATKAPAKAATKGAPTKSMSGTISSADASKLVLAHKAGTKNEDVTFNLSPSTTKTGDMAPGSKATVKYHVENGQNMATSVAATAAKPAAKAPAATKSKTAPSTPPAKTKLQ